jgi:hypothetical protein
MDVPCGAGGGSSVKPITNLLLRSIFGKKNDVAWNLTAIWALTQVSPTQLRGRLYFGKGRNLFCVFCR